MKHESEVGERTEGNAGYGHVNSDRQVEVGHMQRRIGRLLLVLWVTLGGAHAALAAFVVTSTTPAHGALVQPPTTYTVMFSQPVFPASLTPGELTLNGVAASAVMLVNSDTVAWSIPVRGDSGRKPRAQHGDTQRRSNDQQSGRRQ